MNRMTIAEPTAKATENLQDIANKTVPRVFTTVEDLNSEEAAKVKCLVPSEGPDVFVLYHRTGNGKNQWVSTGGEHIYASEDLMEEYSMEGEPSFTPVHAS